MRMTLRYERDTDYLEGMADAAHAEDLEWIEAGSGLRLGLDRPNELIVAFKIDGARHFVSFYPIWRFFGDEGVRQVAAFQSSAVAKDNAVERTVEIEVPNRHRREVRGLLRRHFVR
jgi:hypothetical protein